MALQDFNKHIPPADRTVDAMCRPCALTDAKTLLQRFPFRRCTRRRTIGQCLQPPSACVRMPSRCRASCVVRSAATILRTISSRRWPNRRLRRLDQSGVGNMDEELRWFAGLLGEVRDCQVQCRRFIVALDEFPKRLVLGPVRARIREDLQAIERPARAKVTEAMNSERYLAIMTVLRHWRSDPPVAEDLKSGALMKRARRAEHKAVRRLMAAIDSDDDAMLHSARKAAKRARYAAELRTGVRKPNSAKRAAKHYQRIQDVLGDHQDAVVASSALRRIGTEPEIRSVRTASHSVCSTRESSRSLSSAETMPGPWPE